MLEKSRMNVERKLLSYVAKNAANVSNVDTAAEERGQKRKLKESPPTTENNSRNKGVKNCKIDSMEQASTSTGHSPNNVIIRPINNKLKPGFACSNHFHQNSKGNNMAGYGSKPAQAKKLVIKNFKGLLSLVCSGLFCFPFTSLVLWK